MKCNNVEKVLWVYFVANLFAGQMQTVVLQQQLFAAMSKRFC